MWQRTCEQPCQSIHVTAQLHKVWSPDFETILTQLPVHDEMSAEVMIKHLENVLIRRGHFIFVELNKKFLFHLYSLLCL